MLSRPKISKKKFEFYKNSILVQSRNGIGCFFFLIHQHIECEYKKVDKVLVLGFNWVGAKTYLHIYFFTYSII